jgi:putative transposase
VELQVLEIMPDHIHIFIQIGPNDRPSDVARTLKSISAVAIFTKFPELKGRKFWGSGNVNEETIRKYIENQKS